MGDLISRAAVLEALDHERKMLIEQERYGAEHIVVHHTRRMIEELPSVDAVPVEWLEKKLHEGYHRACTKAVLDMWQNEQEAR